MAGTFLQRTATVDRSGNVATVLGQDFDPPISDLRLFDLVAMVDDGGGTGVAVAILNPVNVYVDVQTGVASGDEVPIVDATIGKAVRGTWTDGTGGSLTVYASPKYNGAL